MDRNQDPMVFDDGDHGPYVDLSKFDGDPSVPRPGRLRELPPIEKEWDETDLLNEDDTEC